MKQVIPQALVEEIIENQIKYHITGGFEYRELVNEHTTKTGTTIRYTARRNWFPSRGLSYKVDKETIGVKNGYKVETVLVTSEFGRESIEY